MPGLAKTQKFMLNTATVMIGPQADLHNLNPAEHSIGLVKNFTLTAEPSYTELGQGVKNEIVFSVLTNNPVRATMETYEYTARNLAYGLGLADAESFTALTATTAVNGAIVAGSPPEFDLVVDDNALFSAGDFILIKNDSEDDFVVREIASTSTGEVITVTMALPDIADNAQVLLVNKLAIGSKDDQPYYAAKISGKLADGTVCVIEIPKLRIIKGFSLAFTSQDFGNLPFEFTIYSQVTTDPFYTEFGGDQSRMYLQ